MHNNVLCVAALRSQCSGQAAAGDAASVRRRREVYLANYAASEIRRPAPPVRVCGERVESTERKQQQPARAQWCVDTGGGRAVRARVATWLILPVVICLSQRLSHACLSTRLYTAKLRMAH